MLEFIVPFADKAAAEKFDRYHGTNGELVRCKDCKYYDNEPYGDVVMCYRGLGWTDDDDYCSFGERRDSE